MENLKQESSDDKCRYPYLFLRLFTLTLAFPCEQRGVCVVLACFTLFPSSNTVQVSGECISNLHVRSIQTWRMEEWRYAVFSTGGIFDVKH